MTTSTKSSYLQSLENNQAEEFLENLLPDTRLIITTKIIAALFLFNIKMDLLLKRFLGREKMFLQHFNNEKHQA